jgi:trehalose 6-phosphate phosphatase
MALDVIQAGREALLAFARGEVVVGLDFDGTLAPIVDDRDEAKMRPRTHELLQQLAARFPCIVVSGRAQADVLRRLRGSHVREVIGNHGLEPWRRTPGFAEQVKEWQDALAPLAETPGVDIEDKIFSLAIHYRRAPDQAVALQTILEAVGGLQAARIVGGKLVVNVLPANAPDKGWAVLTARDRLGCQGIIYVGDDETDEDVFKLEATAQVLGVRVGGPSPHASLYLRDQADIDDFLALLLEARPAP